MKRPGGQSVHPGESCHPSATGRASEVAPAKHYTILDTDLSCKKTLTLRRLIMNLQLGIHHPIQMCGLRLTTWSTPRARIEVRRPRWPRYEACIDRRVRERHQKNYITLVWATLSVTIPPITSRWYWLQFRATLMLLRGQPVFGTARMSPYSALGRTLHPNARSRSRQRRKRRGRGPCGG